MDPSRRIALIDDDRGWLETLADYLRYKGWQVYTAEGGIRGLELLAQNKVGLVVVDFHMPDLDGLELIRQMRGRGQDVRVLLLSSEEDPELPARALAQGAAAFLSKNEAPALFLKSLATILASLLLYPSSPDKFLPALYRQRSWLPVLSRNWPFSLN